jgi:hypothetical protein
MNRDLVVDTHILQWILNNYDSSNEYGMLTSEKLSRHVLVALNNIISNAGNNGFIIASAIAVIEIANKYDEICEGFSIPYDKFKAFITQPPSWFLIEPISVECISYLSQIDCSVILKGESKPIEINDAIHVATTLIRNENSILATNDNRIKQLPIMRGRLIY